MRSLTRRSLFGLTTAAAASGLAACGSSSSAPGGSDTTYSAAPEDLSAELRYAIWDKAQEPAMQKIVDGFTKKFPNITVSIDVSEFGSYWTKIQTEASSDTLPDVFWMNPPNFQLYAENEILMPLTSMIGGGALAKENYTPAVWDLYRLDDVQYGVPKDNDAMAIWFNKKLLKEYGVDEPVEGWTWEDLRASAEAVVSGSGGDVYGFSGPVNSAGNHSWYNSVYQAGGYILNEDHTACGYDQPGTVEGVTFWRDLLTDELSPSIKQLTDTSFDDWFSSGKLAMAAGGTWQTQPFLEALGDDLGVISWAAGSAGNQVCVSGLSNVMPAVSKNPQASMAFLEYLGGEEAAIAQAESGVVIPAYNGAAGPFYDSIETLDLRVFEDAIANGFSNPATKNTKEWQSVELEMLLPVFTGEAEVESTCEELFTTINDLLAEE